MGKTPFSGFVVPEQNWSKMPHAFINAMDIVETVSEMKVIVYIMRHTWGFSEFGEPKKITLDEFMNGRKKRDGSRIDNGTGLSKPSVVDGLKRAVKHGFVKAEIDDSDKARVKKFYSLHMEQGKGLNTLTPDVKDINPDSKTTLHRTEKETKETNKEIAASAAGDSKDQPITDHTEMKNLIISVFGWNPADVTAWGPIDKTSDLLRKVKITESEFRGLYEYCTKKFDNVKPTTLPAWVAAYRTEQRAASISSTTVFVDGQPQQVTDRSAALEATRRALCQQ